MSTQRRPFDDRVLNDQVLVTSELDRRPARSPDFEGEAKAMRVLAQALADSPREILTRLAEEALRLCRGGSAGISILENDGPEPIFRWHAVAGKMTPFLHGTMPRHFSPCGVVLDRNATQLMKQPVRYFDSIASLDVHLEEVLLVPFYRNGVAVGTIWVVSHEPGEHFDAEDRRVLTSLAQFTSAASQSSQLVDEERHRLFDTLMQAPIAVAVLEGPEHKFVFANPLYRELVNRHDIVGKTLFEALPEVRGYGFDDLLNRVKQTGEPLRITEAEVKLNDRHLVVDFTYAPLISRGVVNSVIAVCADVSDEVVAKRQAQVALAGSEFLLQVAAALGGAGLDRREMIDRLLPTIVPAEADFVSFWTVDAEARCQRTAYLSRDGAPLPESVNDAPQRYDDAFPIQRVALTREALIVDDVTSYIAPASARHARVAETLQLQNAAYIPILRGNVVVGVLACARRAERPFSKRDVVILESVGSQVGLALENARLHAETARLHEADERATAAKDEFLARVSHDLRNPLSSILGWAGLLSGANVSAAQTARGLEVIQRSATAQVQLIEDLLDISRIAEGKMRLELSAQDMPTLIHDALEPALQAASKKGVQLQVQIAEDVGTVVVDPSRFRQVVWNLAANAVKFTPAGGHVRIHAHRDGSMFELRISDTGAGIAPEFLPRIFSAFEQAVGGSARTGGLGLGLTIVRHVVELHLGTITADSGGAGLGATFVVRLPIRTARVDAEQASKRLAGVKVLCVDDEDESREIVRTILQTAGAELVEASSADEALVRLREERPTVVVSDITMPNRDGHDLMRAIRKLPANEGGRVPSVALTSMARSRDRVQSIESGFNTHVPKPVDPEELVMIIVGLLHIESSRS